LFTEWSHELSLVFGHGHNALTVAQPNPILHYTVLHLGGAGIHHLQFTDNMQQAPRMSS